MLIFHKEVLLRKTSAKAMETAASVPQEII
jgi:hypothetical protein